MLTWQSAEAIQHSLYAAEESVTGLVHLEPTHPSQLSRAALERARVDRGILMLTPLREVRHSGIFINIITIIISSRASWCIRPQYLDCKTVRILAQELV